MSMLLSEPIWYVRREPVLLFVGRRDQSRQIAEQIQQKRVVVSGIAGVGKSELAVQYARQYFCEGNNVVWINAEKKDAAKDSFRMLLKGLGLKIKDLDGDEKSVELMAKEVYLYFSGEKSLFIFDNAKKYSMITEFLPPTTSGVHVLITSQNRDLLIDHEHYQIELSPLPENESIQFLKEALGINNTQQDNEIKELVEICTGLPIVLQHIVSYVKQSDYVECIGNCVEILQKSGQEIRSFLNLGKFLSEDDVNGETRSSNVPLHANKRSLNNNNDRSRMKKKTSVKNGETPIPQDTTDKSNPDVKNNIQYLESENVIIKQVKQLKFNRRPGTAGMSGQYYEINLAMFYLLQGLAESRKGKIKHFYLASNMKEAGDFDDVVFRYDYKEYGIEKSKIIFLQAKHREKLTKNELTLSNMLANTEKGDFLLKKYFNSYREIRQKFMDKKEPTDKILGTDFKDCYFIIFTNTLFSYGTKEADNIKKLVEDDCILYPSDGDKLCYQLILGGNKHSKITDSLQISSEFNKLVKGLAEYTISTAVSDQHKRIIQKYYSAVTEIIVDQKNANGGKFRNSFLRIDNVLSSSDRKFRDAFLHEIQATKKDEMKTTEEVISELMEVNITLPGNEKTAETTRDLPSDVEEHEIKEFLSKLKLFVKQPNEYELGTIIKEKIASTYSVDLKDADKIFIDVQTKIMKWWKEGGSEVYYLTEIDDYFQDAKEKLSNLHLVGLATLNTYRLDILGLCFKSDIITDYTVLINNKRILNFVTGLEATLLTSVKVHQALKETTHKKSDYKYISMSLHSVLNLQEKVVEAFQSDESNLLVLESEDRDTKVDRLYKQLKEVLSSSFDKKIILIAHESDALVGKFENDYREDKMYECIKDEKNALKFLTNESQEIIMNKHITLQGSEISLNALLIDQSQDLIDADVLCNLFNNKGITIDKAPASLEEIKYYYINRIFIRGIAIRSDCLKQSDIGDVFVISNIEKRDLSNIVYPEKVSMCKFRTTEKYTPKPKRFLILDDDEYALTNLKQLYRDYQHYKHPIHWLKKEGEYLIWHESQGALTNLRQFIERINSNEFQADQLTDIKDRVVIISAEPGMGKTTVLTKLVESVKKSDPSLWVVRINLNDQTNNLSQMKNDFNQDEVITSLSQMLELQTSLEEELLKRRIFEQGRIALIFDGFDEICPTYKEKVVNLLKFLKSSKVDKLWVTTRPYWRDELEDKLSVLSFTMKPLSREDQISFLQRFWCRKLKIKTCDISLNIYIEGLLNVLSNCIADREAEFTGVPLQTRMLAEAFQDDFKQFLYSGKSTPTLPKKLNLVGLYRKFIHSKYEIYNEEKKKQNPTNVSVRNDDDIVREYYTQNHQRAALSSLFEQHEIDALLSESQSKELSVFIAKAKSGREMTGLICQVVNNNISFVHRTFAEYFAAYWLAENFKKEDVKQFLLRKIFKGENEVLRVFFDRILATDENHENIHNAVLNNNEKEVHELLSKSQGIINDPDGGGRTGLLLAAAYGYEEVVKCLLTYDADITKTDEVFNWSPLRYTDKGNYWGIAELLLNKGANGNDMNEAVSAIKHNIVNENNETLLHLAAQKGYSEFARILVGAGADVNSQNKNGKTTLHCAAEYGHLAVAKYLVNNKAGIDINSSLGPPYRRRAIHWTPLHWAAFGNHSDVVKLLMDEKAKIMPDSNGHGPLVMAMRKGHLKIVERLGGCKIDRLYAALFSDNLALFKELSKGEQVLVNPTYFHDATVRGSLHIVQYLVENGVEINNNGAVATPLSGAAGGGSLEVVKFLVENGADINVKTADGWTALHAAARASRSHEDTMDLDENDYLNIVKYLVEREEEIDIDVTDKKGTTPLQTAAHHNRFRIVRYLIKKGANMNFIDKLGATIALSAAMNNNFEIIKFLIKKGAVIDSNVGILGELQITVLHLAAMFNALELVITLVQDNKANVNAGKGVSLTPLHFAALSDNQETIKYLIEHGADVNVDVNFSNIVNVLKVKRVDLKDSSMYILLDGVNNFFSNCLQIKAVSSIISVTPNIVAKLAGHKNELLDDNTHRSIFNRFRGFLANNANKYVSDQFNLLNNFIELRKIGKFESSPQNFMLYLPDDVSYEIPKM